MFNTTHLSVGHFKNNYFNTYFVIYILAVKPHLFTLIYNVIYLPCRHLSLLVCLLGFLFTGLWIVERWQSLSHTERKLYLHLRMLMVLMSAFLGCTCKSMAQIVHPLIKGQANVIAFFFFF